MGADCHGRIDPDDLRKHQRTGAAVMGSDRHKKVAYWLSFAGASEPDEELNMTDTVINVNGIKYVRDTRPTGTRAVVVVDRGWIFAGDVTRKDGRIYLSRCVWVFKWENCGFAAVIDDPAKADIRPIADVEIPAASEIYSIPVSDDWGL